MTKNNKHLVIPCSLRKMHRKSIQSIFGVAVRIWRLQLDTPNMAHSAPNPSERLEIAVRPGEASSFWIPRFCRAGWGELLIWSEELPANFSANSFSKFFPQIFRPCFSQGFSPPTSKIIPKIHVEKSRPELSAFLCNLPTRVKNKPFRS